MYSRSRLSENSVGTLRRSGGECRADHVSNRARRHPQGIRDTLLRMARAWEYREHVLVMPVVATEQLAASFLESLGQKTREVGATSQGNRLHDTLPCATMQC